MWTEEWFEIFGDYFRSRMMFKLSLDGTCHDDRSPVSNTPEGHYATRADWYGQSAGFMLKVYSTVNYGLMLLCYAVNDYANYQSTGLYIRVPKLVDDRSESSLLLGSVEWTEGFSNVLFENSTDGYTEYSISLSRPLGKNEWIELGRFDDDYDNLMYPQTSWFYHHEKYISESIKIKYDEDSKSDVMPGYRDSTTSDIPIKVRMYWLNDGFPEIMDREFYLIHAFSGQIDDFGWIDRFELTNIEFVMHDDDPLIQDGSLRFEGESSAEGRSHVTGHQGGDEPLMFTCYGCGTEELVDLTHIYYGPPSEPRFYSGNWPGITNTYDWDTNEITAAYVQFSTSYIPFDTAPAFNLVFEIEVGSRFNASLTKVLRPDFNFSYPGNIDTTIPIIERIEGEGCTNIGKRALNCPTDGKYDGESARITLYGKQFPSTIENTTVEVTIDGVQCRDVMWWITEDRTGLRNVSCEFGSGVSAYGVNGYSFVQLSYFTATVSKFSDSVRYFNYSHPAMTEIAGCRLTINALHTANCTRTGGGIQKLRISGTNFGASGARVFIGGGEAVETLHDADDPHGLLWVQYGPGTRENERVMVMNSNGGTTTGDARISYEQCALGKRQQSEEAQRDLRNNEGFLCEPCPKGTYSNTLNSQICFPCEPGEYQPNNGSSSCELCPPGSIADGPGNWECMECPVGEFSPSAGLTKCTECSDKQFNMVPHSDTCYSCNDNSNSERGERDSCLCDKGYYMYAEEPVVLEEVGDEGEEPTLTTVLGQTRVLCKECSEGMLCDTKGLNWSQIVPLKGYMPMINFQTDTMEMISCINAACIGDRDLYKKDTEAPTKSPTQKTKSPTRAPTPPPTFSWEQNQQTTAAAGGHGDRLPTFPPPTSDPTMAPTKVLTEWEKRPVVYTKDNTTGYVSVIEGTPLCEEGYTGVMCTDCESNLGKEGSFGCQHCLSPGINALRLLGVFAVVVLVIVAFIRATIKSALKAKSDLSTIGKIGFSFIQFNSMALQFDYEFPPMVQWFLKVQEQPATVANGVMSIDCFVKNTDSLTLPSLYVKSLCYLMAPIFIGLMCRVVFCKYRMMKDTDFEVDHTTPRKMKSLASLSRMELPDDSKARAYVDAWNHYLTAFIIAIFMIHPSIVQMTFALLNCKQLGALDEDQYLIADMTAQCYDRTHMVFIAVVAAPMMVFYVFGAPIFVWWRLYMNRDELTKPFNEIKPDIINRYHFLIKGYEEQFYYWEIIIMMRKIVVVAIAVFFSNIQLQALFATLLVVLVLCVHSLACPYISEALDGLELLSLFGSFCTYFFGQFLFTPGVGPVGRAVTSFVIVLVNLAVVVAIGMMVAGKGATMVAAFGKKFRALICCEKKDAAEDEDEDEDGDEEEEGDDDEVRKGATPKGRKQKLNKKDRKGSKAKGLIQAQEGQDDVRQEPIGLYSYPQGNHPVPHSPGSPLGAVAVDHVQSFEYSGKRPEQKPLYLRSDLAENAPPHPNPPSLLSPQNVSQHQSPQNVVAQQQSPQNVASPPAQMQSPLSNFEYYPQRI